MDNIIGTDQENDRRLRALRKIGDAFINKNIGKAATELAIEIWEDGYRAGRAEGFADATRKERPDGQG